LFAEEEHTVTSYPNYSSTSSPEKEWEEKEYPINEPNNREEGRKVWVVV